MVHFFTVHSRSGTTSLDRSRSFQRVQGCFDDLTTIAEGPGRWLIPPKHVQRTWRRTGCYFPRKLKKRRHL
ncbi:hypothetical protein CVT26_013503 [Gymnopilus dilepis]|uniref:Uncharacterized protein n=1 Tax=Gymnopilus dilepis TaxID=231916 RepID=A0A409Y5R4_9AGAR|nr:hypothetical protein CVT26_013503 [Gymnopilus dilepis]